MRIPFLLLLALLACGENGEPPPPVEPYRTSEEEREFIALTREALDRDPVDEMSLGSNLAIAASMNWKRAAELLLAKGAPVDGGDRSRGTPLHVAAKQGSAHVADVLLRHGAHRAARDPEGRTPAELAEEAGHVRLARYIRDFRP